MLSPHEIRTLQVARRVISPLGRPPLVRDLEAIISKHHPGQMDPQPCNGITWRGVGLPDLSETYGDPDRLRRMLDAGTTDEPDAVPIG